MFRVEMGGDLDRGRVALASLFRLTSHGMSGAYTGSLRLMGCRLDCASALVVAIHE